VEHPVSKTILKAKLKSRILSERFDKPMAFKIGMGADHKINAHMSHWKLPEKQ
jgi:hypothetical protein